MSKDFSRQLSHFATPNSKYFLVLFLLWPFLALISALANFNQKEAKRVVYLFLIYYGLTFVLKNEGYVDAIGYVKDLQVNATRPFSDFFKIVGGLYTSDNSIDILQKLISFIVSRFTTYHGVLFAAYAAVFGYFYLKSINLLYVQHKKNPGWNTLVFLVFFSLILPITTINGFRMWTAAFIFFYGAYHVIIYRDPKYLLFAIFSSLAHWSFLSANIILLIYFFAGNRNFVYIPITIASFILPSIMGPTFQSISILLGGSIQNRFDGYSSEGYMIGIQESYEHASWFLTLSNDLIFYYFILAIIIVKLSYGKLTPDKSERNMFSFLLLFLSFVNFGKTIASFGDRFQLVFLLFATLYVFTYFVRLPLNKVNILTWSGLFPMALYAAVTFRVGSESIDVWIFTPGLGIPLFIPDLSVAEFLFH